MTKLETSFSGLLTRTTKMTKSFFRNGEGLFAMELWKILPGWSDVVEISGLEVNQGSHHLISCLERGDVGAEPVFFHDQIRHLPNKIGIGLFNQ